MHCSLGYNIIPVEPYCCYILRMYPLFRSLQHHIVQLKATHYKLLILTKTHHGDLFTYDLSINIQAGINSQTL